MPNRIHIWSRIPLIRFILPLISGILLQWYLQVSFLFISIAAIASLAMIVVYYWLSLKRKYQLSNINGIAINTLLIATGALLVFVNDIRNHNNWIGHHSQNYDYVIASLEEPLVEKQASYKALASVHLISSGSQTKEVEGKILLYFKKDSSSRQLKYGSVIVINSPLDEIKNSGNPGAFDYKQYCLLQGITHQAFLSPKNYLSLSLTDKSLYKSFIYSSREKIVNTIRKYIESKKEAGLAEALLIGYKDDLDKTLVESYSNTGVVHVIAISGLHLGIIYTLLLWLTKILRYSNKQKWLRFLVIVSGLWLFSLLAGAQPSVLRSAVMFSCLALGEVMGRHSDRYNTLLFSAMLLLCWNPFTLWDVGFQLSYSAVLSILIFYKPICNLRYVQNKFLKKGWELIAVTLAAQILTTPISLYHFHQFPLLFLPANIVAVPLSFLILYGELLLMVVSFIDTIAHFVGYVTEQLLLFMNWYIELLDGVSFSTWKGISISIIQTIFLLAFISALAYCLIEQKKKAVWLAMTCLCLFFVLRSQSFINALQQREMIVYNVPKHQAIDLIEGRQYRFLGDSVLLEDAFLRNFHLQPSRVNHRMNPIEATLKSKGFQFGDKRVLIVDSTTRFAKLQQALPLDVLVLSKNPKLYMRDIASSFSIKQVVFDASVPIWKKKLWIRDCDSLHLSYYDVAEKGAFVMKVQ